MSDPTTIDQEFLLDVADPGYQAGDHVGNHVDYANADAQWCWGDALADGIPRAFAILSRVGKAGLLTEEESRFLAQFQRWEFVAPAEGRSGTCLARVAEFCILRIDVKVEEI